MATQMNWIISDIHGCFVTLEKLLSRVWAADENPQLVFIGDYVDRGPRSKEVVDLVVQLQKEGAVCLRGNHDDVIDWLLNDHCLCDIGQYTRGKPSIDSVTNWWMWNGLEETLVSYGVPALPSAFGPYGGQSWGGVIIKFREQCPTEHKDFFRKLEPFWSNDTHFACHAYFPPGMELPDKFDRIELNGEMADTVLWRRFSKDLLGLIECQWSKVGVFGHTPVQVYGSVTPIKTSQVRLIDCGLFKNGYMCAYCCETDNWILQDVDSQDVA